MATGRVPAVALLADDHECTLNYSVWCDNAEASVRHGDSSRECGMHRPWVRWQARLAGMGGRCGYRYRCQGGGRRVGESGAAGAVDLPPSCDDCARVCMRVRVQPALPTGRLLHRD